MRRAKLRQAAILVLQSWRLLIVTAKIPAGHDPPEGLCVLGLPNNKRGNAWRSPDGGKLGCNADKNDGSADAEFREMLQLRDADALIGKVSAIGRVHVAQADDVTLDFDGTVPA